MRRCERPRDGEFHSLDPVLGTAYPDSPIVSPETQTPGSNTSSSGGQLGPEYSPVGDLQTASAVPIIAAADRLGIPLTPAGLPGAVSPDRLGTPLVCCSTRPARGLAWTWNRNC